MLGSLIGTKTNQSAKTYQLSYSVGVASRSPISNVKINNISLAAQCWLHPIDTYENRNKKFTVFDIAKSRSEVKLSFFEMQWIEKISFGVAHSIAYISSEILESLATSCVRCLPHRRSQT